MNNFKDHFSYVKFQVELHAMQEAIRKGAYVQAIYMTLTPGTTIEMALIGCQSFVSSV